MMITVVIEFKILNGVIVLLICDVFNFIRLHMILV